MAGAGGAGDESKGQTREAKCGAIAAVSEGRPSEARNCSSRADRGTCQGAWFALEESVTAFGSAGLGERGAVQIAVAQNVVTKVTRCHAR